VISKLAIRFITASYLHWDQATTFARKEEIIMATLTITSPATMTVGSSYAQNVGRAARALLTTILAFNSGAAPAATAQPVQEARHSQRKDLSLYQLYALAAPYDAVMPNMAQELQAMACRDR
jgi:hypothetical protein